MTRVRALDVSVVRVLLAEIFLSTAVDRAFNANATLFLKSSDLVFSVSSTYFHTVRWGSQPVCGTWTAGRKVRNKTTIWRPCTTSLYGRLVQGRTDFYIATWVGFPWITVVIVVYRWITAAGSDRRCRHVVVIVVLVSGFVVALWTTAMHVEFTVKYKSNICIPHYMSETTIG